MAGEGKKDGGRAGERGQGVGRGRAGEQVQDRVSHIGSPGTPCLFAFRFSLFAFRFSLFAFRANRFPC